MTARSDANGSDAQEAALSPEAPIDDPLSIYLPESQETDNGSDDSAALHTDAMQSLAPSVPFATPGVTGGKDRTAGVVHRVKRVFGALDIARNFEKAVDNRFEALRNFDQEVNDRARRLEWMKEVIIEGAARADDVVRAFRSFEQRLADLRAQEHAVRAVETTVADCEDRAWTVSTRLDRHLAACEEREAVVVDAVQQIERRAADTLDDFEARVGDCEARTHVAQQTITHLHDVSSRTLPELQERLKKAEEQNRFIGQLIDEAERMAASLTALEQRLPAVGRCDQDLARIELAVPQLERQLEDLNASAEQQIRALAVHQQLVRQTLDESQKTAIVVSELEGRIADLSCSHQQLDRLDEYIGHLEQRAAAAVGEFTQAAHAKNNLEQEIAVLQTQLRSMAKTAEDEATKLEDLRGRAERYQQEHAERTTAIVSGLETQLDRFQPQLEQLAARLAAASTEMRQSTGARNDLEDGVAALQSQLRQMTRAADDESKRLGAVRQEAERYQREETHRVSAVLAGLETRIAEIGRTHQALDVVERHVEKLEQRAAAAEVGRATRAAEYRGADRASNRSAGDPLITLRFRRRRPKTWRRLSPARLIFGGVALALSAAIVFLVSGVWRIRPVAEERPATPLPLPVLASRALTLAPTLAVAPLMPLTAVTSGDLPEAARPAPKVPAAPVARVVVSETPVATSGGQAAAVREQPVSIAAETRQFVGTLLIESEPAGAAAFVNQASVGDTPVLLKDVRAGSYVVRVEYEGYQRWSTATTVSAIREARVKAKLEREGSR